MNPGDWLTDEDTGAMSLVLESGDCDKADVLVEMIRETFGGLHDADRTHPTFQAALAELRIEQWRRCSEAKAEAEGKGEYSGWWAPDGDEGDPIWVAYLDRDPYWVGEECVPPDEPLDSGPDIAPPEPPHDGREVPG